MNNFKNNLVCRIFGHSIGLRNPNEFYNSLRKPTQERMGAVVECDRCESWHTITDFSLYKELDRNLPLYETSTQDTENKV